MAVEWEWETRPKRVKVYANPTCDRCHVALEFPIWPSVDDPDPKPDDESTQYPNALRVDLWGGYGSFIDGQRNLDLCATCATALFEFLAIDQAEVDW